MEVLGLLRRIHGSPLGEHLILGRSSGLYGVSETIPALTEDVDVLVDADWVAAAAKLLTIRLEKGSKDKLQALLVIAENAADGDFLDHLRLLLRAFPADRIEDAVADAQAALLAVSADVTHAGPQAAGYAGMHRGLEQGLAVLLRLAGFAEDQT